MSSFERTDKNRVKRVPIRAEYDRDTIYRIVDDALICHVGFVQDSHPFVIPILHARDGDRLLLHGAKASRLMKHVGDGHEICATITFLDGLVLARSVFHHSMNYRSAVLFGTGWILEDEDEKMDGLRVLTDHIMPGRWDDARLPTRKELNATSVVAMDIQSASAKIRTGPPVDDEEDYDLRVWAGVLPMQSQVLEPLRDKRLQQDIPIPGYIRSYQRKAK